MKTTVMTETTSFKHTMKQVAKVKWLNVPLFKRNTPELIVDADGTKRWFIHDNLLHNEDGPAVERADGTRKWYINGKQHREDGPAVEWFNGSTEWYVDGNLHRTDGPAVEWASGHKYWYVNGKRHRTDGPAVDYKNGHKSWWFDGHHYGTFDEYAKAAKWTDEQIVEWRLTNENT